MNALNWFLWCGGLVFWPGVVAVCCLKGWWAWRDRHPLAPVDYRPRGVFWS